MSDCVRVGVIGTSWYADLAHLPRMKSHPRAQLVAICGRNRQRADEMAAKYEIPAVYTDYRAMIQAGGIRLRPILMTAVSSIAGIMPIAIGFGGGGESRRPMGVAVVGGLWASLHHPWLFLAALLALRKWKPSPILIMVCCGLIGIALHGLGVWPP